MQMGMLIKESFKMIEGNGIYESADSGVYKGEFKAGKAEGNGICRYPNGDFYQGLFRDGEAEGNGIFTSANGDIFQSKFKNGEPWGKANMDIYKWRCLWRPV